MKQIKTLTINGNSYEIADPDAAHIDDNAVGADAWSSAKIHRELTLRDQEVSGMKARLSQLDAEAVAYTAQEPTPEQKAQVRANIGAADDAELQSIRVGADGVTYPTAADAVRHQVGFLMKAVADGLMEPFAESGAMVICEPAHGYPLSVQTADGATKVMRTGKNLFDFKSGVSIYTFAYEPGNVTTAKGYEIVLPPGTYTMHAEAPVGFQGKYVYGVINRSDGTIEKVSIVKNTTLITKTMTIGAGDVIHMWDGVLTHSEAQSNAVFNEFNIQIEAGATQTEYEPYNGNVFAPGETISTLFDTNTLWADAGEITVTGWKKKAVADGLMEPFAESGAMVICEPAYGYPLSVQTADGATKVMRTGKNLFDFKSGVSTYTFAYEPGNVTTAKGYEIVLPPGTYTMHAEAPVGFQGEYVYGVINRSDGTIEKVSIVKDTTLITKTMAIGAGDVIHMWDGVLTHSEAQSNAVFNKFNIQIEAGATQTEYEPYNGNVFAPGQTISTLFGTNTLWADAGEITVTGWKNTGADDDTGLPDNVLQDIECLNNMASLKGKTIVNFGDSIFGNYDAPSDISTELARRTGASVYNCGFAGCTMAQHSSSVFDAFAMYRLADSIVSGDWTLQSEIIAGTDEPAVFANKFERLKTIDFSKVDIITIAYGTNDFTKNIDLDNPDDPYDITKFAGALRYSIQVLLTKFPHLKIFVCSQTYRFWKDANNVFTEDSDTHQNEDGVKLTDFVAKTEEVAKQCHLPYINNYDIGMNKYNRGRYFTTTDGTHPVLEGRHLIAANIAKELF